MEITYRIKIKYSLLENTVIIYRSVKQVRRTFFTHIFDVQCNSFAIWICLYSNVKCSRKVFRIPDLFTTFMFETFLLRTFHVSDFWTRTYFPMPFLLFFFFFSDSPTSHVSTCKFDAISASYKRKKTISTSASKLYYHTPQVRTCKRLLFTFVR